MYHAEHQEICQWLTEKAVSKMTGLSLSTIQKHRFYGKGIPYSKIGRAVRYAIADVIAYMESKKIHTRIVETSHV